jgi:hypothetical protein
MCKFQRQTGTDSETGKVKWVIRFKDIDGEVEIDWWHLLSIDNSKELVQQRLMAEQAIMDGSHIR